MYTYALSITAPIILTLNMQLKSAQTVNANPAYTFTHYLWIRSLGCIMAVGILSVILLFQQHTIQVWTIVYLILFSKVFESLSDLAYGVFQKNRRMDYIGRSQLVKGGLLLAAVSIGILVTGQLEAGLLLLVLVWGLRFIGYDLKHAKRFESLQWKCDLKSMGEIVKKCFPLGIVAGLGSFNTNIPRYVLEHAHGMETLGLLSAMTYMMVAGNVVFHSIGQSMLPRLASQYRQGQLQVLDRSMLKLCGMTLIIGAAAVAIATLWSKPILTLLYGAEYAQYPLALVLIIISAVFGYVQSFFGFGLLASQSFYHQLFISMFTMGSTLILSWILIPNNGLLGAASTLLMMNIVSLIASFIAYQAARRRLVQNKMAVCTRKPPMTS